MLSRRKWDRNLGTWGSLIGREILAEGSPQNRGSGTFWPRVSNGEMFQCSRLLPVGPIEAASASETKTETTSCKVKEMAERHYFLSHLLLTTRHPRAGQARGMTLRIMPVGLGFGFDFITCSPLLLPAWKKIAYATLDPPLPLPNLSLSPLIIAYLDLPHAGINT